MIQEELFNEIFENNFKRIFLYCYNLCGDYEESYDIAQEVFIRASQEGRLLEEGFNVKSWLYKVARNVCFDYFRKIKSKFAFLNLYKVSPYYEIDFQTNETYEEFHQLLQELPVKYREVLYLRCIAEMPYKELAEFMDLSTGTVMSRLSRGKDLLREVMENENR
ncbi:RNA polymerase sigma factor [bacterium]|nr:RNA polymerase sigma factor [bacterium]